PGRRPDGPDDGARQHRPGLPLVRAGHPPGHQPRHRELRPAAPAVARGRRQLGGQVPYPVAGLHLHAPPAGRRTAVRLARLHPLAGDRRAGRVLRRRLLPQQHLLARRPHQAHGRAVPHPVRALRARHPRAGDRRPRRPGVHAEELAGRGARVPPLLRRRPRLRPRPVAGGVHRADPAHRGLAPAGHREDAVLPRLRGRLPAPALPDGPRRAAPEDRAGAARPAGRGGRARAPQGVRQEPFGRRARGPDPRVAARPQGGDPRMRLVVVSAGLSVPSSTRLLGDRLAAAAKAAAGDGSAEDVRVIELRDLAVEIAHTFTNGFAGRSLSEAYEAVTRADALIVVTPVFSASYSGLFKSFFDGLSVTDPDALAGKPVLIAATGGTARHSLVLDHALRPLFSYLKAVVVPTGVYAASEDWGAEGLDRRIERAAGQLVALTAPAGRAAASGSPDGPAVVPGGRATPERDSFEEVVPFEERLAALRPTGCDPPQTPAPVPSSRGRTAVTVGTLDPVPHTVLLAEDDRAIRHALERALTLEGYRVTAVADGLEALAQAHRSRPDVLVLDVMMPGIDGLQVCRALRAEGDRTPVLMLTALVETADRIAGLDAGADDYVVKPFDVDEVFARLRALLRRAAPAPASDAVSGGP